VRASKKIKNKKNAEINANVSNSINCVDIPVALAYLFVFDCCDSDSKITY
jgi:hypothetical protein